MSHRYTLNRDKFRNINKKKLVVAAIFIGIVLIVTIVLLVTIAVTIINALLGQTDSSLGRAISDWVYSLWNAATNFVRTLWGQIIANPLKFVTGGNN